MLSLKNETTRTLDTWLIKKDNGQHVMQEDTPNEPSGSQGLLNKLIDDFIKNIHIPELKDSDKISYKLYELLPEGKRGIIATEKAKVASSITRALGGGQRRVIKTSWGNVVIFDAVWNSRYITIIPLRGHIMDYDVVKKYSGDWRKTDPIELLNHSSLHMIVKEKNIVDVLRRFSPSSDLLILATDADEEGANIGLEVFDIVKEVKNDIKAVQMWFISLDIKELRNAFLFPIEPKWSWAYAVRARRVIDAMVGFSATRELTVNLWDLIKKLGVTKVFSIGRVQTPTLYILYLREKEIENFKPKPYWVLYVDLKIDDREIRAFHEKSPFSDKLVVEKIYDKIKNADKGLIVSIEKEKKKIRPQPPLNTTRALMLLNEVLGLSSKTSMKILEDLYLNGLITYPRTETDKYPQNYSHEKNLRNLLSYSPLRDFVSEILRKGAQLRRNGSKLVGDHLPITPIATPRKNISLSKIHLSVYDVIVRRYIALFLPDAEISKIHLQIMISNEPFKSVLTKIENPGFFVIYPYNEPRENLVDIELKEDQELYLARVYPPEKKMTQPPPRLTEGELISIMERLGLGTKSTRPDHIETLISRGYVDRKGKKLSVTRLGYSIISFLEKIWPDFVKPYFSAKVYILMRKVMNKELDWQEMIDSIRNDYLKLFNELRENIKELSSKVETAVRVDISDKKIMDCPKCGSPMILKSTKSAKSKLLYCTSCGYNLIVPTAKSYMVTDVICIICKSRTLALKRPNRILYICPVCWRQQGPCYKCSKLEQCGMLNLIKKEEEKYVVGKCSCGGLLKYYPEYRFVRCDKCGKKFYLPSKGSISLLKKRCKKHDLRIFSIKRGRERNYYCIACNGTP